MKTKTKNNSRMRTSTSRKKIRLTTTVDTYLANRFRVQSFRDQSETELDLCTAIMSVGFSPIFKEKLRLCGFLPDIALSAETRLCSYRYNWGTQLKSMKSFCP